MPCFPHRHRQPSAFHQSKAREEEKRKEEKKGERWGGGEAHLSAAHDALVLVVAKGAFVADTDEGRRAHIAVADGALAVALVAETADGDAGLLAAHY